MTYKLCKRCKKRMYKDHIYLADYECSLTNGGLCSNCEEIKMQAETIENKEGIFYCPNCNIRTNEKTIGTTCPICKKTLQRIGGDTK